MNKITLLSLFIINKVKLRRLILGISATALSKDLGYTPTYIIIIENPERQAQYSPHDYSALANLLKWKIHDLLPPEDVPQGGEGSKVDKVVLSLSRPADMRLVVDGLIAHGFFIPGKTLDETATYLYIRQKPEATVLETVLQEVVKDRKLVLVEGKYTELNNQA